MVGKGVSMAAAVAGGWWAVEKWRKRDEHFPRIDFEVTANFIGVQDGSIITEVVAILENKGLVPLKIKTFRCKIQGLKGGEGLQRGGEEIRGQLLFTQELALGALIPKHWEYTFVYPGVKTQYNYVTIIPESTAFIRVQADFEYMTNRESHHTAKILKVPGHS